MTALLSTLRQPAALAAVAALVLSPLTPLAKAQMPASQHGSADDTVETLWTATPIAEPLPEDRGAAALTQSLRRLNTWASLMFIVAHPDDEDGALLTMLSRGQGVRTSLMTLTRGEGGQNAMSSDSYDALGVMRTQELLRAGEYYGVHQYWGTEADFGFSKTQEEAFARWGHDRVLYDVVLAIRKERPLVLAATFIGGITDGHGQHQVSGEIAQEAYLAAGDPKVFPEQLRDGLLPWSPLKVYARVPFAPITSKGMFDYATGKWAEARFYNYVTKQWSTEPPTADVTAETGTLDPVLGRSYAQIARQGWGEQKSQNGGANPTLAGDGGSSYHLYGSRVTSAKRQAADFFDGIPTGVEGMLSLVKGKVPSPVASSVHALSAQLAAAEDHYQPEHPETLAAELVKTWHTAQQAHAAVNASSLTSEDKSYLSRELEGKLTEIQTALAQALGLDLTAVTSRRATLTASGPFGGGVDATAASVTPGETVHVRLHTTAAAHGVELQRLWLAASDARSDTGSESGGWGTTALVGDPLKGDDHILNATVPADEKPTQPYFTRPGTEQPYYDISDPTLRDDSFAPYPLAAWAEFRYNGVPVRVGEVVQTMQRVPGRGGSFEPLVVTPAIGVSVDPAARILPIDGSQLPVSVTIHTQSAARGTLRLTLPAGWSSSPAEASFARTSAGNTEAMRFLVTPAPGAATRDEVTLTAVATVAGHAYSSGWRTVGYPGLSPYNVYQSATFATRAVAVKVASGLRAGYVMGTGDDVPAALDGLGVPAHLLSAQELLASDLSQWNVILIGIRAYSVRPELAAAEERLNTWVKAGGTLIVQYQSADFPAPVPMALGSNPEKVVEEDAPVKLLAEENPLLTTPNPLSSHDFDNWVEERGHSFLESWDASATPLTETADHGQDPQRGGLVVAHPGKGTYIYAAYALYRQLPELVPGAYRILANLISAGHATN